MSSEDAALTLVVFVLFVLEEAIEGGPAAGLAVPDPDPEPAEVPVPVGEPTAEERRPEGDRVGEGETTTVEPVPLGADAIAVEPPPR